MKREDIEKLLGGYATGTLNEEERKALFEAAVEDQALFDSLANETALKELLDDPQARELLLQSLPARRKPLIRRFPAWSWAAAGAAAATVVIAVVELRAPAPPIPVQGQPAASYRIPPPAASSRELRDADQVIAPARRLKQKAEPQEMLARKVISLETVPAPPKPAPASAPVDVSASNAVTMAPAAGAIGSGALSGARELFYATPKGKPQSQTGRKAAVAAVKLDALSAQPAAARCAILRQQPDGTFTEVDPGTIFNAGDRVRLSIETNSPGSLLVEDGDTEVANLAVAPRVKYAIPSEGAIDLTGASGKRTLKVVFAMSEGTPPAAGASPLVESRDGAMYIAEPQPARRLSFEIPLTFR